MVRPWTGTEFPESEDHPLYLYILFVDSRLTFPSQSFPGYFYVSSLTSRVNNKDSKKKSVTVRPRTAHKRDECKYYTILS